MNKVSYAPVSPFLVTPQRKVARKHEEIFYPECDGKPMADNTLQFHWIMTIEGNLETLFKNRSDVFVAGDLLWYPVERKPDIRQAPDVLVAFGRPKGHRGSYLQWKESNQPLQVVFEILSPGNRAGEMSRKFAFYEQYGVEEYYVYDPDRGKLEGWLRHGQQLRPIDPITGWVSPRLGIRFELVKGELQLYHPTGKPFVGYVELVEQHERDSAVAEAQLVFAEGRAESAERRAEHEHQRAKHERQERTLAEQRAERDRKERALAEQHAEQERQRAEQERQERTLAEQRAEHERQERALAEQRAEQERLRAEQERKERALAEQRTAFLEAELARLRAELMATK